MPSKHNSSWLLHNACTQLFLIPRQGSFWTATLTGRRFGIETSCYLSGGTWWIRWSQNKWQEDNYWSLLFFTITYHTPLQRISKGVYWFPDVRPSPCPSVHLWTESSPFYIFPDNTRIYLIFTHLINQLPKVCSVVQFLKNSMINIFGKFLKCATLTLSCVHDDISRSQYCNILFGGFFFNCAFLLGSLW